MEYFLRKDIEELCGDRDPFEVVSELTGEIFRDKEGRRTLRFEASDRSYFLKLHQGVGWGEILKNLLQLRLPVLGAENEWRAIEKMGELGIDTLTVAGYGKRGANPARQLSFLITDELLESQSLEEFCADWATQPPTYALRKVLVERLADISQRLHRGGVNHRDYYLCHFLIPNSVADAEQLRSAPIHLMDLHRAQIRSGLPPRRWLVKDLGSLYYSALECGLTKRDVIRFLRHYSNVSAKQILSDQHDFWLAVRNRAAAIYRRDFGRQPEMPL